LMYPKYLPEPIPHETSDPTTCRVCRILLDRLERSQVWDVLWPTLRLLDESHLVSKVVAHVD
jgi:hypothetical protein